MRWEMITTLKLFPTVRDPGPLGVLAVEWNCAVRSDRNVGRCENTPYRNPRNGWIWLHNSIRDANKGAYTGQQSQIIVTNEGSGSLMVGTITIGGDNRLEFTTQNDACSNQILAPSGSCTVSVWFKPAFAGAKSAYLQVPTNDQLTPSLTVNLTGIAGTTVIDQTPPVEVTKAITINGGASITNSGQVALAFSVQDASGVAGMCVSNSNVCSNWEPFAAGRIWALPESDATYSVYVWFRDGLGNSNATPYIASITLDTVRPTVSASVPGGVYNKGQTVALTSSKPGTIYYTLNGTNPTKSSSIYSASLKIAANAGLKFFAVDLAGNQSEVMAENYTVDTVIPALSVTSPLPGLWTTQTSVTLQGKVADGLRLTSFKVNGSDVTTSYDGSFVQSVNLSPGLNQITSVAIDEAGNQATDTRIVGLDQQEPVVAVSSPAGGESVYGVSYLVHGSASDGTGSGVKRVEISTDGGLNWSIATGTIDWSFPWLLPQPGNYTIKVRAVDVAGNTGYAADVSGVVRAAYRLDILIGGTGGGYVTSSAFGISCNSTCGALYENDSAITLKASPSYSIFTGWSGDCAGTGDCSITLKKNASVTATFAKDQNHVARIAGQTPQYYPSLQGAYTAAPTDSTIQIWGIQLDEACIFDRSVTVNLQGGFSDTYVSTTGATTVNGSLTVRRGTVRARNLMIR